VIFTSVVLSVMYIEFHKKLVIFTERYYAERGIATASRSFVRL